MNNMSLQKWQVTGSQSQMQKWETGRRTKVSPVPGRALAASPSPDFCFTASAIKIRLQRLTWGRRLPGPVARSVCTELLLEPGFGRHSAPAHRFPGNISGLVAKVPRALSRKIYLFLKRVISLWATCDFFYFHNLSRTQLHTSRWERGRPECTMLFTAASFSFLHSAFSAPRESFYY